MPVSQSKTQKIIGIFENVTFADFGIGPVRAKIDTGAYTGALHCTKISEVETPAGKVLRISPFDHTEIELNIADFARRHVRSSNGKSETRYFIDTTITIQGETYPIVLSLADRSGMKWPVLIGRRFLRKHGFVVDVSRINK